MLLGGLVLARSRLISRNLQGDRYVLLSFSEFGAQQRLVLKQLFTDLQRLGGFDIGCTGSLPGAREGRFRSTTDGCLVLAQLTPNCLNDTSLLWAVVHATELPSGGCVGIL